MSNRNSQATAPYWGWQAQDGGHSPKITNEAKPFSKIFWSVVVVRSAELPASYTVKTNLLHYKIKPSCERKIPVIY